jgi:FkbM family methyltransferase
MRFSNTYLFYKRGWNGINIDAMPGSMVSFNRIRPRDINIECGVASQRGILTYYCFDEPALNTFDQAEAELKNTPPYRILKTVEVAVDRLEAIIDKYLPPGQQIDFLNVDVEGKDGEVLRSNDWKRYRPRFILAETLRGEILNMAKCPIVQFLQTVGYRPVSKAFNTSFFAREND